LAEHARREGYALLTPPKVIFSTDPDLAMGESGVSARVVQPRERLEPIRPAGAAGRDGPSPPPVRTPPAPAAPPPPPPTMGFRPPAEEPAPPPEPEPEAPRVAATLTFDGREVPLTGDRVLLGRSRECDIRLVDTNVSRRHAEVRHEDDAYWIVDLGSTNGT